MNNKILLTIDIEDWYHIPSVCGSPFSVFKNTDDFFSMWKERYDYLSEPTMRVLDILDNFNLSATFFVVADVVQNYPGLVESIVERGHEIGCHGLHHSCKIHPKTKQPLMSNEEFIGNTKAAKTILEKLSGDKVIGYRAPNGLMGGWMIDILEDMGFRYDSSICINSLYNKSDSSLQGISSHPYYPRNDLVPGEKRDIVEFPWAYLDISLLKIPASGGPMLRFLGKNTITKGLEQSMGRGHTVFYFHPIDISYETFPNIGNKRPFYWSMKGKRTERNIISIMSRFKDRITNGRDLLENMSDN